MKKGRLSANMYVEEWANVCLCVYWKAGSKFPTTLVIASSFVGLAGTKIKKKNTQPKKKKENLEKWLEWKGERAAGRKEWDREREDKERRQEEKGTMTTACCQAKWVVCGFVHSADISSGAGCYSYGCFRTIHAHTHSDTHRHRAPESSAAREHCSSPRVQCSANLKTDTTSSCAGVRLSTWVAEKELQQPDWFKLFSRFTGWGFFPVCVLALFTDWLKWAIPVCISVVYVRLCVY